jgi:hypothetical protein
MDQSIRFCMTTDGVRLAYAMSGDGRPLVMSATWPTHLEHQWRSLAWRPWPDVFSREHKVLRHDSGGCLRSSRSFGTARAWYTGSQLTVKRNRMKRADTRSVKAARSTGGPLPG